MQQRMEVCSVDAVRKTHSAHEEAKTLLKLITNDLPVIKAVYVLASNPRFPSINEKEMNGKTLKRRTRAV